MLFAPTFLSCPVCNADPHTAVGFEIGAFTLLGADRYTGNAATRCSHEFSLYDALRPRVGRGYFGIASVYAHRQWTTLLDVTPGDYYRVEIPEIAAHVPFVALGTVYGPPFHLDVSIVSPSILVVSTSRLQYEGPRFTEPPKLSLIVYYHRAIPQEGWPSLLYDSVADYLQKRHWLSIFKLATSVELYSDQLFERYLLNCSLIAPDIVERMVDSARSWNARFSRLADLVRLFLSEEMENLYRKSAGPFSQHVRSARNRFAHEHVTGWGYEEASRAFEAAFDVLWVFDKLDERLTS